MNIYEIKYRVGNGTRGKEVVATSIESAIKALLETNPSMILTKDSIRSINIKYDCIVANPEE